MNCCGPSAFVSVSNIATMSAAVSSLIPPTSHPSWIASGGTRRGFTVELAKQKRRAAQARSRDVLSASLKHAAAFLDGLCERDKSLSHEVARLTKLLSKYGAADVDAAMAEALAKHSVSAASVAHLLDAQARKRGQLPLLDVVVPESVRHLHVTSHPLSDYDGLTKPPPGEGSPEGGAA